MLGLEPSRIAESQLGLPGGVIRADDLKECYGDADDGYEAHAVRMSSSTYKFPKSRRGTTEYPFCGMSHLGDTWAMREKATLGF